MDYSDLKNKTIFDFTDEPDVIKSIVGDELRENYIADLGINRRYMDFLELADLTGNRDIEDAAEEQLAPFCMGYTGLE